MHEDSGALLRFKPNGLVLCQLGATPQVIDRICDYSPNGGRHYVAAEFSVAPLGLGVFSYFSTWGVAPG